MHGVILNGLKPSLCSLALRRLRSLQRPLAQHVQLTGCSLCSENLLVFSPTQSYCWPGKHSAVPFIAMGSFSLSVQLLFFPFCPFCSSWWMRPDRCKAIPQFGGWQRGAALQFHWFISQKWTEKDLCCCREKLLNLYALEQIRIKASY